MATIARRLSYLAWSVPFIVLFAAMATIGQPHVLVGQRGSSCHYMSIQITSIGFTHAYDRTSTRNCSLVALYPVGKGA